jgi:hypothetical protein
MPLFVNLRASSLPRETEESHISSFFSIIPPDIEEAVNAFILWCAAKDW